jgi:hypothetical protein
MNFGVSSHINRLVTSPSYEYDESIPRRGTGKSEFKIGERYTTIENSAPEMTELPIRVTPLDLEILCNQIILSANSMDISTAQTVEEKIEYLRTAPWNACYTL